MKINSIKQIKRLILFFSLSFIASFPAMADDNSTGVSLNINPGQAQVVPTKDANTQVMALNNQENQLNQQKALSTGKTFVTNAPDPNDHSYWAQKNDTAATQTATNPVNEPINQERLEKEKQGLKDIVNQWNTQKTTFLSVAFDDGNADKQASNGIGGANNAAHPVTALPGTLWYATMAGGADSYVPGVVRIQLQEGPFTGGYALGKFQIAPDGEHLMLSFYQLTYGNTSFPISAVGVDPSSQVSGVTGNIDHHVITRFAIPAAVGFLEGAINLLKANQTVVVNGNTSTVSGPQLSNAQLALLMGSTAADRLQEATTPQGVLKMPEVKIAPGSGIGLLLLKSV